MQRGRSREGGRGGGWLAEEGSRASGGCFSYFC